jgi:hypothetical protein
MRGVARKVAAGALTMVIVIGCALIRAGVAHGAEYRVSACGAAGSYQNHLLSASTSDGRMSAYTACPTDGNGHFVGVAALAGINVGTVPVFANAIQTFAAPPGTTIRRVHVRAAGRTWNGDWTSLLQASADRFASTAWNLSGCGGNVGSANGCVSALVDVDQNYEIPGATGIRALVSCGNWSGCTTFSTDLWPFTRSYYFVHEFDVTLDDLSNPVVTPTGGGLASGQWLRGTHSLTFNASDNSGIRRTRFWVDDLGTIQNDERPCDYTYSVPCSGVSGGEYTLDTTRLSDGVHHVAADGLDATDSNWSNTVQTVRIDNHAPAEPGAPSVDGGEGWHTTNGFTVRWSNPDSAAPIDRAFFELCKADGSGCSTGSQAAGGGITRLANVQVAQPGDYTIRVWLADAAGNVSDAKSAPLHLKFDNVAPAQAAPQHRNGWVDKSHATQYVQEINKPDGFQLPVSGIAGYAVTADGSTPGSIVDVPADPGMDYIGHKELPDLPEGTTTLRARAISGALVPSSGVGSTDIHVDLRAPILAVEGAPDPNEWSREAVGLEVTGSDPDRLSGMASGPGDRGLESGAYIGYAIDGGETQRTPGPERDLGSDGLLGYAPTATAEIRVATDGAHTVTYEASDVAGNATAEKSVSFRIDQTPPELVVFEPQQRSDPRLITVAASDRTSGLADGGKIELRRVAPSRGDWISLRTGRQDDRYYAHVDNTTLPDGDYQFRAIVPDQAGNEAVGTTDRDGREEIIHISPTRIGPYVTFEEPTPRSGGPDPQDSAATVDTKLVAVAVAKVTTKPKCTAPRSRRPGTRCPRSRSCRKSSNGRRRKRCRRPRVTEQLVHELRVPFGKRASIRGVLLTDAGAPITDAEITILARPAVAGADYVAEASVRTDEKGAFTYRARAGEGRTLDFHYRGDKTYKHADDQVILRVPASATIKASRNSIRNGGRVLFNGRLRGRPYPARGKVLDLQAFYRHKWRTFATPRASRRGQWKYRYRFQATRGVVIYKFRIRVRASSDYAYELGYSKVTKVRVFGP